MELLHEPRPVVVKVDVAHMFQDTFSNHLIEAGFQVVKAASIKDGIKVARRCKPHLILVIDNPKQQIDAASWLEAQHTDTEPSLAVTPLLIVASQKRAERLRVHELPDRVQVVANPTHPSMLSHQLRLLLSVWDF